MRIVFFITVLLLFIYGLCLPPSLEIGIADELKTGSFMSIPEAVLGKPVPFENMIDEHECYPLFIKNQFIGWIHTAYKAGARIIVTKCFESKAHMLSLFLPVPSVVV